MIEEAANTNVEAARAALAAGRWDEAIDQLRSPGAPKDPETCALLARAFFERGDTRGDLFSAHFFALRAMELGRDSREMRAIRAMSAFRKEGYAEAAEQFAAYVAEDSPPASQLLYGLSLFRDGQLDRALPWLRQAAEKEPSNPAAKSALAEALEAIRRRDNSGAATAVPAPEKPIGLGGFLDTRPEHVATPYKFNPLTKLRGHANTPKDMDWLDKNIPCQRDCPAKTDIPGYLSAIYRGDYDEAYRINLVDNVFPAVLGRVCSRPCESACRHGWDGLGEPVAICFSKRSAADFKTQDLMILDPWFPATGKKIAVVGSGVAGLAAARNLALMGHEVTVYERHSRPGGMMNQGIPEFRLPRDHIDKEIEQIRRQGVKILCDVDVGRTLPLSQLLDENDAVVLAAGTLRPNLLKLPGADLDGIVHGLPWLLEANETGRAMVGEHVVVIGGGFTAMDCARTARRLGAHAVQLESERGGTAWSVAHAMKLKGENIRVSYRRSRNEMLVTPGEVEELNHEGIPMEYHVSPLGFVGEAGRVTHMRFVRTELGEPDASGRRRPVEIPGSEFEIPADTILLATGQFPQTDWIDAPLAEVLVEEDGWLKSGKKISTALEKIFTAGDFATGASTLIEAIAHGKDAARAVDTFLMGEERLVDVAVIEDADSTARIREMDQVDLMEMPMLPLEERTLRSEVEQGFERPTSVDETQRCYFCHYKYEIDHDKCIYCDWCIKAKPRPNCILKIKGLNYDEQGRITGWEPATNSEETHLIWINQEDCIRCNACVDACPVDCISIQKVSRQTVRACDSCASTTILNIAKGVDTRKRL